MNINPPSARATWLFYWLFVLPIWLTSLWYIANGIIEYLMP